MGGETSLLIFSICLQAAIGTMLFITLGKQLYKDKLFKRASLTTATLSAIGVLASLIHLGQPLLALNSLLNLGSSWLSKEVLSAGIFMGIAVVYVLVQYLKPIESLSTALRWGGSVVGLFTVFSMAKVYTFTTVALWQGANTFVDFYATTIAIGALLFLITSLSELQNTDKKIYGFIVLAAVIIQASVAVPHTMGIGLQGMASQGSAEMLSSMSTIIGLKWLLILGGAGILLWPATQKTDPLGAKSSIGLIYVAGAVLVVGEIIGRYIFYAAFVAPYIG